METIKKIMSRSTSSRDGDEDDLDQDDEQSEQGFGLFDEPTKVEDGEYGDYGEYKPSAPPPTKENNYENTPKTDPPLKDPDIADIKSILNELVNQVSTANTEVKSELARLNERVTKVEAEQKRQQKRKHRRRIKQMTYDSSSALSDDTTDDEKEEVTVPQQPPLTVANVITSMDGKTDAKPETNPYYLRGPQWRAAWDAMFDTPFKGQLRFKDYESLLQRSGQYKTISTAADTQDVLAHLQLIREKFCSLKVSPDAKTFTNVVIDKIPPTLRKNLSLARSRGLITTEEQLCAMLKQLIVGGSSFPAEKLRARQQLLEKFPQQDRSQLDINEVALYCMGDLSERVVVTKRNYSELKEGEKDLLRQTIAKDLFNFYIEKRCSDALEFIQRNMHGEEDLLQISARISAYLKNPPALSPALVGNVNTPDPVTAAEQLKRNQEKMDQKVAELLQEKEKLLAQNSKLRRQAQNAQGTQQQQPGQQPGDRRQFRRRPEDHRPCRFCVANYRSGLDCYNLKNQPTNQPHCFRCSTASRMEVWPCPPCQLRYQQRREERRLQRDGGGQPRVPQPQPNGQPAGGQGGQ